jgi:hypothetical protein
MDADLGQRGNPLFDLSIERRFFLSYTPHHEAARLLPSRSLELAWVSRGVLLREESRGPREFLLFAKLQLGPAALNCGKVEFICEVSLSYL